jgi:acyl-CoA hydrolase
MENHKLVLPEHMNHYGFLFGGNLLKWVDEAGWIAASLDHPGARLVTIGMDKVEFRRSVKEGAILKFEAIKGKVGNSSVTYMITVSSDDIETGKHEIVFSTNITFVCVDSDGAKCFIGNNKA